MTRWLPDPWMASTLTLLWLLLVNTVTIGHLLLGALLGIAVSSATRAFWRQRPRLRRPWGLLRFVARVLGDILIANLQVARLVLGPTERLRPAFIEIPLELTDETAIVLLAEVISLTPGTLSADIGTDRRYLFVHTLDTRDPGALVAEIKARYEAPLKEILG